MLGPVIIAVAMAAQGEVPKSVPYRWKSVQVVGAGFVDGIVTHPTAKNVRFIRTDMGGAYRWDTKANQWMPMLDWVPYEDLNWMGVESIAVDPTDPKKVFLACGTYTNPTTPDGAILRSSDGGRTFKATRVPIKFGGNENGRGNGERMTVDPNSPNTLYLGTRNLGLWQSEDGAVTWKKVKSFPWKPSGMRGVGVVVTLCDPVSGKSGQKSKTIYVAVSDSQGPGIYRSDDTGQTWKAETGCPTGLVPTHLVRGNDGALWATYASSAGPSPMFSGAVYRKAAGSNTWQDVTPDKPTYEKRFGYVAVAVDAQHPNTAIVSTFLRQEEQIFRTTDGGKSWRPVIGGKETYNYSKAPYTTHTGIHWLCDIEIDPHDSDHAMFTTGYGGHETFDLTNADKGLPVHWASLAKGIEESVPLTFASPTKGAQLLNGIGDYGSFVHYDLDNPPTDVATNPRFGNTNSIAVGDLAPHIIVRLGRSADGKEPPIGFSLDSGKTWQPPAKVPLGAAFGTASVSSNGKIWIVCSRAGSYRTTDQGATWSECVGLPNGTSIVADRVDPDSFYAVDLYTSTFYRSTDGGSHFTASPLVIPGKLPTSREGRGDGRGGQDQLYTTPGKTGELWLPLYDGLYRSQPGKPYSKLPGVTEMHAFGFGKEAKGASYPTLYMVGIVNGLRGIFRSTDEAKSWVRINDNDHQWGLILLISGDPKKFGRVYVGTHGRGAFYGDPK